MDPAMKIGELAKLTGFSVQAIRYYEKEKLLPTARRSEGNFRLYNEADAAQLQFIKLCRGLDLSLSEIRQLLIFKCSPGTQCYGVTRIVDAHIQLVEARIRELTHLSQQLKTLRGHCSNERTVEQCGILQTLSSNQT